MPAENHCNQLDVKKRKLEEVHQTLLSTKDNFSNSKSRGFVNYCIKTSLETIDEKHLQTFYNFATSGKTISLLL